MAHPLEQSLADLRRRFRRLLWVYGLGWTLAVALAVAWLLGMFDYWIHFQDRGLRAMGTLAVCGALAWAVRRFLWRGLAWRLSDVELAQRVERHFPTLEGRLASSVEFLRQPEDDPWAGSPELRRAVVRDTSARAEGLRWPEVLDIRPVRRAAAAAAVVLLVVLGTAALRPQSTWIALRRLANPWSAVEWPKEHHLAFRRPVTRLAYGQPFEVELIDSAGRPLPPEVWIWYRTQTGTEAPVIERQRMQYTGGTMIARKEHATRPFAYRAVGGDDQQMPWIELELVEPPVLRSLNVQLDYPDYTGWADAVGEKDIRALKGTRIHMQGSVSKPLQSARVHLEQGEPIVARLSADGTGFEFPADPSQPWIVEQSGAYWFEFEDLEGLVGESDARYQIRAVTDLAPTVTIDQPQANVYVTPSAELPVVATAKDDLRIRDMTLVFSRSDHQGEESIGLYAAPRETGGAATGEVAATESPTAAEAADDQRTIDHRWDLAPLNLAPETQVTFHVTARDDQPAVGQSQARRIIIIRPEELQGRLAERQSLILNELNRVLELEREARTQTRGVQQQWQAIPQVRKEDLDRLQGAELTQRQVRRGLTDEGEGVRGQVRALLDDLHNNHLDHADIERQMQGLLEELARLEREDLPIAERELNRSVKAAQAGLEAAAQGSAAADVPAQALAEAGHRQEATIASLERLVGSLRQWDNYRRFHREMAQLRDEQRRLAEQSAEVGQETLSKDLRDLTPQQRADLERLATEQQELGRRFDKLQQQMHQMQAQLAESDPLASDTIGDAVHQARQQAVGGQMHDAGRKLAQNQVGQAGRQQSAIEEQLDELLDILSNRREHELSRLVKKLREGETELARLREAQAGLRKKADQAAQEPAGEEQQRALERLTREERQLAEQVARLARRLERLQAEAAARTAASGGQRSAQAGEQAAAGDASGAAEQAAAAEQDLAQAQAELAERRQQAEQDLAAEQLARLEDALRGLSEREQQVVEQTRRLEEIRATQGRWSRGQSASVRDLSREQQALAEETGALQTRLQQAEVFLLALRGAQESMRRAAELLDERRTGNETQVAETQALERIRQVLEALAQDQQPDKPPGEEGGEGGGGSGSGQGGDSNLAVAQIKMLKLLQMDLNRRTAALAQRQAEGTELSAAEQQTLAQLSDEQGLLADLVRNLLVPTEAPPENDPDELPTVQPIDAPETSDADVPPSDSPPVDAPPVTPAESAEAAAGEGTSTSAGPAAEPAAAPSAPPVVPQPPEPPAEESSP